MDKVQKLNSNECYTPSSEPFRMSSGMLRCVAFVRTDVSEELRASIIRVARIGEYFRSYRINRLDTIVEK
jgi:hypothetical protein